MESEDKIASTFLNMYDRIINIPDLFTEGFMETNFLRYHVLLHDNHNDSAR